MTDRVGQQLGNYQLVGFLGRGSQAEVYLGQHRYLHSSAALKVLHASLYDSHVEQFLAEAQTLVRLVHPSIVRVLDFTVEQGTPVLIMDYSPAGTMRHRYPPGTCLPLSTVVSAVSQVAEALQYAHTHHVIHRDVKPENLLLGSRDEILLSDFGLSVFALSPELLSTQAMAGTLPYMAPEQLQGHPCFASDQYSLAIVAYEWLTGKRPFTGSQWQLIQQQLYAAPPPLRELNPSVPLAVEAVVLRALAKDPQDRYVSVQGFAHGLARASQTRYTSEDSEVTAPLRSTRAEPQDELLSPSNQDIHHTPPWSSPVQRQVRTEREVSPSQQVNRQRLLAKVRTFWITGVLEHSLHGAALIALGLQEQPDAVANPWHLVLESQGEPACALPSGTSIVQVYDEAVGELLILGEPGSGKTTLLLELARTLLDRASQDEQHPLPVVFNLSSWAVKQQPLDAWLVEELNTKYQVPRKLGQTWVDADQILPLLDGLDEVAPASRAACVEAINIYRLHHGLVPTVVCSRRAEYTAQTVQVLLRRAVVLQPLTQQQIDTYLLSAGEPLASVRAALRADPTLCELATTPLMLSVLTLAFHGQPVEDLLASHAPELQRRRVFEHYVERMLQRRGTRTRYTPQQTTHWLARLAHQMKRQSQTVFYIEHMQPDWLPESWLHRPYYRTVVRLGLGIVSGLIIFLTLGIAIGLFVATGPGSRSGFVSGLLGGFLSGLAGGLVIALTSRIETEIQPAEVVVWSWPRLVQVRSSKRKLLVGISSGLTLGLLMGLWAIVGSGASARVLFLVVLAIAFDVVAIIVLAGGLTSGVASKLQNERYLTVPNQGMRQSVRNSLRIGIIGGLVGGSISMVAFSLVLMLLGSIFPAGFVNQLCFLLLCGSLGGTISGLIVGLPNGGIAYMQHLVLRLFLWRSNLIPWHYPRFLDYAAEHILLRKVGGGYIFIHRLLLDYFASLEAVLPSNEA